MSDFILIIDFIFNTLILIINALLEFRIGGVSIFKLFIGIAILRLIIEFHKDIK